MLEDQALDITTTTEGGRTVARVAGEIDAATCDSLTDALSSAMETDGDVELDVSGVTFIDSSGLRALVLAQQQLSDSRHLVVRGADARFRRLLHITGLDEIFSMVD